MPISLRKLRPAWLKEPGRDRMGVELDCPFLSHSHRVRVWFANPPDGGPPASDAVHCVYFLDADSDELELLTVLHCGPHSYRPVWIGHWFGWLIEGELAEASGTW